MSIQQIARLAMDVRDATASKLARRDPALLALASESVKNGNIWSIFKSLAESRILIWNKEILRLALSQSSAFEGAELTKEMLAHQEYPEFWWMNQEARAYACLIYPQPNALTGIFFNQESPDHPSLVGASLRCGSTITGLWSNLIAASEFIRLKVAAKEPVYLARADRRLAAREGTRLPEFRVVQLRGREASIWHGLADRKYHHSWIVRGHWRKLHEPRKGDGAVASWIESYVKGQGPLLQPREPIFSVSR